ncbi:hypothetical protein [Chitinophaga niabensis]|uniref:Uncharacterized protein n=1 Tax=Chitinophaga niabensis TaxID=536979 RepID=A0A1N6F0E8_9BACT|nr:hypothetical protein [Chitinophaga niabensis]SIN88778.1 hypothetical protein SAMN04488055_1941 [Chitinophaga niabensis]
MLKIQAETVILNQIKNYHGIAFQEFGDRLLSKLYPDEYIAVRAGGTWGDLKNDGYCHINRTFFHFYATSQHNVAALKAKITADINGCLEKQQQVDRIVFVTNDANLGVIEAHIDDLRLKNNISIDTWGPNRLVEIICALPPKDIAALLNMVLQEEHTEKAMSIQYVMNGEPYKTLNSRAVKGYAAISVLSGLAFILVFFYGFAPIPFGWYCLLLFLLFGLCFLLSGFIGLALKAIFNDEWVHNGKFYRKEGNKYLGYVKVAYCPYPHCDGFICVQEPPEKEKKRFELVGCCTTEPMLHTFSYNENNIGYPVHLDFSAKK